MKKVLATKALLAAKKDSRLRHFYPQELKGKN